MHKKKVMYVAIVLLLISVLLGMGIYHKTITTFSAERWNENIYTREHMLEDLIANHHLEQWDYDKVLLNLGENGLVTKGEHNLSYIIGKGYVGPTLFNIHFDEIDKVESFSKVVD